MSDNLSQRVAGLPMPIGMELLSIVQNIESGSPEAIRDVATQWRSAAGKASEQVGRLNRAVGLVDNSWNGNSAETFVEYMRGYRNAGIALHDALDEAAKSLDNAAKALDNAKTKIATLCEPLLTYKGEKSDLIKMVGEAIPKAVEIEKGASDAMTTAMNKISGELKDRSPTFASITDPNTKSWATRGNADRWKPVVIPKTTLQSGTGGNGYTPTSYGYNGSATPSGDPAATGGGPPPQPLTFAPGTATGDRIVQAVRQHLGKPYVWGANGPNAFDCSGLVYYVLNQAGIKIGDTTAAGYQATGKPVSSPQPGDIVFFGQPATHVGIYIGDGKMIHAPNSNSNVMEATVTSVANGNSISYRRFT